MPPPIRGWGIITPAIKFYFPSVLRHYWLGDREGIWPVKKLGFGLLVVKIMTEALHVL